MLDNFIFDFGNVLVRFDEENIAKPYLSLVQDETKAELIKTVFDRKYWDRLDDGSLTETDVCALIKSQVPNTYYSSCCDILENWYKDLPIDNNMLNLIKYLKSKNKKIYLLSNISLEFAENYSKVKALNELFSYFDGLVFSASCRLVKPNKEIFLLLLEKYKIQPQNSIFIDDRLANINTAKSLDINTFLYQKNFDELNKTIMENL
ncbi:MAG: HAD family phosphatase [Clostridia bacterium]|nr:HAD family phosphatase [Clostridia bacterium]